jgi:histidinol phosphatase-like enzyme
MEKVKKQNEKTKEIITFKTQDGVTVTVYGKPNFEAWARKMLELYNQKLNTSAS